MSNERKIISNDDLLVPIISMAGTFDSLTGAEVAARAIGKAARDTGFFYLVDHGVDQTLVDRAFIETKRFFSQPEIAKMGVKLGPGTNGYRPSQAQRLDPSALSDLNESYGFGEHRENRWPSALPGFKESLTVYFQQVLALGRHVSQLIAMSLDLPMTFFDDGLNPSASSVTLRHYLPRPAGAPPEQVGAGAHTDFGWITLLAQDNSGGLEVELPTGEWISLDPVPGAFVVNLGDLVERWTNGRYHSNVHRVVHNHADRDRYSIVCFCNPSDDTAIECLPTCIEPGQHPRFEPCTAGQHRDQRALEASVY